jgi:hypothetical protein
MASSISVFSRSRRSVWSSLSWRKDSFIERCSAEAPIKGASQALFVNAEVHERFRVVTEGLGGGESGVGFGMAGIEVARGFKIAHAEHAVFNRSDAVDAPLIVGDRLGELALDRRLRVEAVCRRQAGVELAGAENIFPSPVTGKRKMWRVARKVSYFGCFSFQKRYTA